MVEFEKFFTETLTRQIEKTIDLLLMYPPSLHVPVQSQQWKDQNNVYNLLKVTNKDTRKTSLTSPSLYY